jgi:ABC-type Na+ efflux pump permease subunit
MDYKEIKELFMDKKFITLFIFIFVLLYIFVSFIKFLGQIPILLIITFILTYYYYKK